MTTIRLSGIRASGRHGANPGERDEPQEFVVDLEVEVEAGADTLSATADYRDVVEATRRVIEDRSFVLVETIAREVTRAVGKLEGVGAVKTIVHKPGAATKLGLDDVAAENG